MASSTNTTNTTSEEDIKVYKGVRKRKWGKWVSEIRLPNSRERIWLGSYDTQEKAARAFDAALYCLRGTNASFNFPDTPLNVVVPRGHRSLSHQEIQEVAAKFANDVVSQQHSSTKSESNSVTTTNTSNSLNDEEGDLQVEMLRNADWTFFNMLDDLNAVAENDFGFYDLHAAQLPEPPLFFEEGTWNDIQGGGDLDAFSNHSLLWSWNF